MKSIVNGVSRTAIEIVTLFVRRCGSLTLKSVGGLLFLAYLSQAVHNLRL